MSSSAVLNDLPVELLVSIFFTVQDISPSPGDATLLNLSLVCRRWEAIVEETPHLWRHIELPNNLPSFRLRMKRSRESHLEVSVRIYAQSPILDRTAQVLVEILPRTRSLAVEAQSRHIMEKLLLPLSDARCAAPVLEELRLVTREPSTVYLSRLPHLLDPCPRLRGMTLSTSALRTSDASANLFAHLTDLTIIGQPGSNTLLPVLIILSTAAPSLMSLAYSGQADKGLYTILPRSPSESREQIELPRLTRVNILVPSPGFTAMLCFMAPSLATCRLYGPDNSAMHDPLPILEVLRRFAGSLTSVELVSLPYVSQDIVHWLLSAAAQGEGPVSLREVILDSCPVWDETLQAAASAPSTTLRRLELRCSTVTGEALVVYAAAVAKERLLRSESPFVVVTRDCPNVPDLP